MSLGALNDEASLKRWLEQQLDVLRPPVPLPYENLKFDRATLPASGLVTASVVITHGLGKTPKALLAIATGRDVNMACLEEGKTTFKAEGRNFTGAVFASPLDIFWWAVV